MCGWVGQDPYKASGLHHPTLHHWIIPENLAEFIYVLTGAALTVAGIAGLVGVLIAL